VQVPLAERVSLGRQIGTVKGPAAANHGNPRMGRGNPWVVGQRESVIYPRPCLASLSRNVEGFMPSAAAAAVLLPPAARSAFSSNSRSAWPITA
jgi:hypothetical protein